MCVGLSILQKKKAQGVAGKPVCRLAEACRAGMGKEMKGDGWGPLCLTLSSWPGLTAGDWKGVNQQAWENSREGKLAENAFPCKTAPHTYWEILVPPHCPQHTLMAALLLHSQNGACSFLSV